MHKQIDRWNQIDTEHQRIKSASKFVSQTPELMRYQQIFNSLTSYNI